MIGYDAAKEAVFSAEDVIYFEYGGNFEELKKQVTDFFYKSSATGRESKSAEEEDQPGYPTGTGEAVAADTESELSGPATPGIREALPKKNHEDIPLDRTRIITVGGAAPGVGTTHQSIQLSNYLSSKGYHVACVEMNHRNLAFYTFAEKREIPFYVNGVVFYPRASEDDFLRAIGSRKYQYVIADMAMFKSY